MTIEVISLFLTGDPGGIQTHDLQNRNLMLYSAKLQGQSVIFNCDCEDNNKLQRNNCKNDKKKNSAINNKELDSFATKY